MLTWAGPDAFIIVWVPARYAMREALEITRAEGLEALWARHNTAHQRLWAGLKPLGLQPFVEKEEDRLISVNTIKVRLASEGRRGSKQGPH